MKEHFSNSKRISKTLALNELPALNEEIGGFRGKSHNCSALEMPSYLPITTLHFIEHQKVGHKKFRFN